MVTTRADVETVARVIAAIPDPEVPVITIDDLGILRGVEVEEATGALVVTITPTYSGCPAMETIGRAIATAAADAGWSASVRTVLSPAWTTDWISERGRKALREFGIAPPGRVPAGPTLVPLAVRTVNCPQCGSPDTEELSRFAGTACKALRRCVSCREPFEEFKAL